MIYIQPRNSVGTYGNEYVMQLSGPEDGQKWNISFCMAFFFKSPILRSNV